MVNFISPYEISEMFHKKFDGFDFAEPYLNGVFEDDPKKGRITIGVRTPWYDFEYFVYSKESFWGCIANVESVEDVIQGAVGHLNAAVAMQLSPNGSNAKRFDIDDINKYQDDPEGYGQDSDEKKRTADFGVITAYVKHNNLWSDRSLVEAHEVIFLCACRKCQKYADHILELRREK